jgi:two-component system response regulator DesR
MDAGARGFMVKDAPVGRLATAVRDGHHGRTVVDPELAVASLSSGPSLLTDREREVLRAGADGASVGAGADGASVGAGAARLMLSEGTVRYLSSRYLSSAIGKASARNRVEATRIARDNGWL